MSEVGRWKSTQGSRFVKWMSRGLYPSMDKRHDRSTRRKKQEKMTAELAKMVEDLTRNQSLPPQVTLADERILQRFRWFYTFC